MKKLIGLGFFILIIIFALYLISPISQPEKKTKLKVATTIFPLYDLVKNIAKDKLEVSLILKPGASPHTFEPNPEQVKNLSGSALVFAIGYGLDDWAIQLAENAGAKRIVVVDKNIKLIKAEEEVNDNDETQSSLGFNPHYWLSASNAYEMVMTITDELVALDPENASFHQRNADMYLNQLKKLDQELKTQLEKLSFRKIATFHDAWVYFAKEYALEIVATFEPFPGKNPTPSYLAWFQKKIKEGKIKVIFSEPQLSVDILEPIAQDLGVEIVILDPLGGEKDRESYIELLRFNAEEITQALK